MATAAGSQATVRKVNLTDAQKAAMAAANPPRDLSKPYNLQPISSQPPMQLNAPEAAPGIPPAGPPDPNASLASKYPNPYADLNQYYQQLYGQTDTALKDIYGALGSQLEAGKTEFSGRSQQLSGQIGQQYDSAARDISAMSNPASAELARFAASIGGQQALNSEASANLTANLARIAALNSSNRAASQSNFDLRRGNLLDLLIAGKQDAEQRGAAARANLTNLYSMNFGNADTGTLYQQYLTEQGKQELAKLQLALQMQQQAALASGGGSGGGGGGGGGGRRSSGRKSSGGGSSAASTEPGNWPPTYEEALAAAGGDTGAADTIMVLSHPSGGLQQRLDTYNPTPTVPPKPKSSGPRTKAV